MHAINADCAFLYKNLDQLITEAEDFADGSKGDLEGLGNIPEGAPEEESDIVRRVLIAKKKGMIF